MPMGVTNRDLVQKVSTYHDEATNTTYISALETTHPSKPEVSGTIRLVARGVITETLNYVAYLSFPTETLSNRKQQLCYLYTNNVSRYSGVSRWSCGGGKIRIVIL